MAITSDWHIHTHCSCDSACMNFETLISDAKKLGITDFGVSDHFHTRIQELDIAASRREYEKVMMVHPELSGHFHFGIEATIISKWEIDKIARGDYIADEETPVYGIRCGGPENAPITFDFDEDFLHKYKIDYVVAGMHWPMYCKMDDTSIISEYHRQYMFAATHPYTTILAHYLWWDEGLFRNLWKKPDAQNPFINYFEKSSEVMRSELKAALIENNVAFELNGYLFNRKENLPESFVDEYLSWAAELQKSGVVLSMGSDNHSPSLSNFDYERAAQLFEGHGINTNKFFKL